MPKICRVLAFCEDPDCLCDEGGIPDHEIHVAIPLSVLQYLAVRAELVVTLLRNNLVWIGEEEELEDLVAQLGDEQAARFAAAEAAEQKRREQQVVSSVQENTKLQTPNDELDVIKALEEAAKKDQSRPRPTFLDDVSEEEGGSVL